jgi:hypothetical protein
MPETPNHVYLVHFFTGEYLDMFYTVHYTPRKNSKRWQYVCWGETKTQCLDRVNSYTDQKIAELKEQIAILESKIVKES